MNNVSIVIPAYKEEENLQKLLPELCSTMELLGIDYEVIIVDANPSLDNTEQVCAMFPAVKYILRTGGNFYGDAVRSGIAASQYPLTVIMDADCSHSPEELPAMLAEAEKFDLVIASRYIPGGNNDNSKLLVFLSQVVNSVYRFFLKTQVSDLSNSFRVYRSCQLKSLNLECNNFDIVEEIISKLLVSFSPLKIKELPCSFQKRAYGTSKRNWAAFIFSYIFSLLKILKLKK